MVKVVAAIIWREDRFMICQRPAHKARGFLWEFAGGKVEQGESDEEALIRECREELDIEIGTKDIFMSLVHKYPDMEINLILFNAYIKRGEPKLLEHKDIKWITTDEIPEYDFCPADEEILKKLMKGRLNG